MTLAPDARRRVLAASLALSTYAATSCTPAEAPEPFNATHETDKLDYPAPHSIETADSYRVEQARPPRARVGRSRARGGEGRAPQATGDVWHALAMCESGMRQDATSPSGRYLSYFQWSMPTWRSVGGEGDPRDAPYDVQVALAKQLQARSGFASQWPACSRRLGLRD